MKIHGNLKLSLRQGHPAMTQQDLKSLLQRSLHLKAKLHLSVPSPTTDEPLMLPSVQRGLEQIGQATQSLLGASDGLDSKG